MRIAIRYYTKTGNTKKLADAIEEVTNVKAKDVSQKLTEDVDILFLGSSVYAAGIDNEVKRFINDIDVKIGKVVNFSTTAVIKSTKKQVEKLLKGKNIKMDNREFYCKGSFGLIHKGKPNKTDLENIQKFVQDIINGEV